MAAHARAEEKRDQWLMELLNESPGKIQELMNCFDQRLFCNVLALESEDYFLQLRDDAAGGSGSGAYPNDLLQGVVLAPQIMKQKLVQFLTFGLSLSILLHTGDDAQFVAGLDSVMREYTQWVQEDGSAPGQRPDRYPNLRPYMVPFAEGLDFKQVVLCFGSLLKQTYMKFFSFMAEIAGDKQMLDVVVRFDQFVKQEFLKYCIKVTGEVSRAVVGTALADQSTIFALNQAWKARKCAK